LCLGYKADVIKEYFVNYNEYISNDFVYSNGGNNIELLNSDIENWNITFVDTGMHSNIGSRLQKVKKYLKDDEIFLANYSDGLTDLYLPGMINDFKLHKNEIASFMVVQPTQSFHVVKLEDNGDVNKISHIGDSGLWINAGYFIFRKEIFDYINEGEDLVNEPFIRLIREKKLHSFRYSGFWKSMDTFKDKQTLDEKYLQGDTPWEVWKNSTYL
jgi:glucose-1-phosphate cytidylyltransferase